MTALVDDYSDYYDEEWCDECHSAYCKCGDDLDDEDLWECSFPDQCLMPSPTHRRSECYTREMAEAWMDEQGGA